MIPLSEGAYRPMIMNTAEYSQLQYVCDERAIGEPNTAFTASKAMDPKVALGGENRSRFLALLTFVVPTQPCPLFLLKGAGLFRLWISVTGELVRFCMTQIARGREAPGRSKRELLSSFRR